MRIQNLRPVFQPNLVMDVVLLFKCSHEMHIARQTRSEPDHCVMSVQPGVLRTPSPEHVPMWLVIISWMFSAVRSEGLSHRIGNRHNSRHSFRSVRKTDFRQEKQSESTLVNVEFQDIHDQHDKKMVTRFSASPDHGFSTILKICKPTTGRV